MIYLKIWGNPRVSGTLVQLNSLLESVFICLHFFQVLQVPVLYTIFLEQSIIYRYVESEKDPDSTVRFESACYMDIFLELIYLFVCQVEKIILW